MKLTDTYTKTMADVLKECDIVDQKIHTDECGNIMAIEMKYRPKDIVGSDKNTEVPHFMKDAGIGNGRRR